MKKILLVFGTRPEAIKMVPLIKEFSKYEDIFEFKIAVTAQHREMLDQILNFFEIIPDYDLNIMKPNQDLYDTTSAILLGIKNILLDYKPDLVIVHGDTTTTFAASLSAFYNQIKIAHIEAGLRTNDLYIPWPEEANRQLTGVLANYHFAPTNRCKENLLSENKNGNNILVTGNTVIDTLLLTINKIKADKRLEDKILKKIEKYIDNPRFSLLKSKIILVTGHRRENFGDGFRNICEALMELALNNPDFDIIYPVHLNPNVQKIVRKMLSNVKNIYLIKPLNYEEFVYLMDKSYFIITDSGGIQEEAPSLGKPVLVTREVTEREEAVEIGTVKLVGTKKDKIVSEAQNLIEDKIEYTKMCEAHNPYGDGKASEKIVAFLRELIC